jgi:DNA-binding GntR family transcriptional regulator
MSDPAFTARTPSLTEQATSKLTDAIVSGRFPPGQRLVETELSLNFGISRAPLREALRTLTGEGLVESRPNRGCYVAKPSLQEMENMVLLRALLEGAAARIVCFNRDPEVHGKLKAAFSLMKSAREAGDNSGFRNVLWVFHRELIEGTNNKFMQQSWKNISNVLRLYINQAKSETTQPDLILRHVSACLECLTESTPDEAEALFRGQILWMAYDMLQQPIADELASYITRIVDEHGHSRPVLPDELARRLRSFATNRASLSGARTGAGAQA